MITIENITRKYGDFKAVDDVSFSIAKGQIVGLLGHNGAGKTTIMKIITGFIEPDNGSVFIAEQNTRADITAVQSKIGYLPESIPLYPEMTIIDYLEYAADLKAIPEDKKIGAIKDAIAKTDLSAKAQEQIFKLSKGYKQRVGVAQAILGNPEILILDEPTNGLDPVQIRDMRALIKELAVSSTVIISTHIMQEVEAICERVLILERGKLVFDDTLASIRSSGGIVLNTDQKEQAIANFVRESNLLQGYDYLGSEQGISSYALQPTEDAGIEVLPRLTNEFVKRGWQIYGFSPREQSLESLFRQVSVA